ncbi:hypothetical protein [Lacticaseibacillus chiayiensis]|uniref:Uncharacterized protein n=1 Tax=Lacticaseibacillus chiayiensis TaxID=2100821 RepID=A0ABY6H3B0_9LACO|nr:hypothetical protein [Lacticaseibacillus chiayiensis]UYN55808.1 hypothetical protein OFW50_09990 [Lacticaseibacillus chiayiensis]
MKYWRNFFLTFGVAMLLAFIISVWLRGPLDGGSLLLARLEVW